MSNVEKVAAMIKAEYPHMIEMNPNHFWGTWNLWEGRQQNLHIELKGENIVYSSAFATDDQITPAQALHIAQETIFGIVLNEPHYLLRHVSNIATITKSDLQRDVSDISGLADYLENQISNRDLQ